MGIGLGGFLDGIVLHQILQWHHLLTDEGCCPASTVGGLEDNTLADGLFHAATWVAVLAGSIGAVRAWQRGAQAPTRREHRGGGTVNPSQRIPPGRSPRGSGQFAAYDAVK